MQLSEQTTDAQYLFMYLFLGSRAATREAPS